jgi:tetratricopeptide (TPR) repeat protein
MMAASKDIYALIEEKFPGVKLESAVQGWAYLEEYEKGIEAYRAIIPTHATAQDDRWLGVCYFQLFDDLKAIELYYRAIARGEEAARINLAHAFQFVERSSEVLSELARVAYDKLSTYDKVVYLRVKSHHQENNGQIEAAIQDAELAWRLVQGLPELPILAPQILGQLGVLQGRMGRAKRAMWFFEQCLKQLPDGLEKTKAAMRRAQLLNILGQFDDSLEELDLLNQKELPQAISAGIFVELGDATWGKKNIQRAEAYYEQAVSFALASSAVFEEFKARLSLVALTGHRGLISTASEHLARAKVLIADRPDALIYQLRDLQLSYWAKEASAEQTLCALARLATEFAALGLAQEQGWVQLFMAEMYRQEGDDRYLRELDALQQIAVTLQNNAFLAREWTLVPKLRDAALKTHPKIAGKSPDLLEIYSMGEEKLVLNGKVVTIRLRKGVEMLTYFLEHPKVSLKKLLLDVFADEEPKAARNYFHQFKFELHDRVPGLTLEYDANERVYSLRAEIDILWDVAEVRAGRKMGAMGIFLPGSGSDWALLLEHQLEGLRETSGALPVPQPI